MKTSRRQFLGNTGGGAAAIALLTRTRQTVADEIASSPLSVATAAGVAELRSHYSMDPQIVYLNHASIGTTPIPVRQALVRYLEICETNPWLHIWGGAWEEPRESVRKQLAALMRCRPVEIAITHNTTELFNTLAHGLPLRPGGEVLFSSLNHAGASVAFEHLASSREYSVRKFEFPIEGIVGLTPERVVQIYEKEITPKTQLLILPHIDNTIGLLHPVEQIATMARDKGVQYIAVDGAQSVGVMEIDVQQLGVDAYATSAHKWLGSPKGLGIAYLSESIQDQLQPMWVTWGQRAWADSARKYEDYGTRNFPELLALGDAVLFHSQIKSSERNTRLEVIRKHLQKLAAQSVGSDYFSPVGAAAASPVVSIRLKNANSQRLAKTLFEKHSIVVRPFLVNGKHLIRVSANIFNSLEELERLFQVIDG